ncbi:MAG TPA: 23S rRNA (uracil(1939)-C(5))-methyltransferase RlmD [Bacteroidetes bacterium]|nr:23S rRNA (uracil(1939)-C(5))-methyltransferase RlmD [Bacteroidota bacterium]
MGRRKGDRIIENVVISAIGAEGNAIGRKENQVVFVPMLVPGDVVDVRVRKKRKNYIEGSVVRFREYSADRIEPLCKHFGVCGGCKWQHLPYGLQLKFKEQQVVDNLTRIAKIDLPPINPIIGSKKIFEYRNKLEFSFSSKRWLTDEEIKSDLDFDKADALGFHIPGLFDKVLDIKECHLQPEPSNTIREAVKRSCRKRGFSFYDFRQQSGFMRNLIIRNNSAGDVMAIVVFFMDEKERREALLDYLAEEFPRITSLMYVVNTKKNDSLSDQEAVVYRGADHLIEEMEGLKFRIGAKTFFQTNSSQALELYRVARDFAGLTGEETVYDLYTGAGTIANFVASRAKKVIGVEYVEEAVHDAVINSELNGIANTLFVAGDMKDILTEPFFAANGKPNVIITDPPRAGMHGDVVKAIDMAAPDRIVYVSCNPATQARDLSLLSENYKVTKVQPIDMFPHTHHVENVVLLERVS